MNHRAWMVSLVAGLGLGGRRQQLLWQADLQIRSLRVSAANGNLTARVVVATEIGEALSARVDVLLPVGVGIVSLGVSCSRGRRMSCCSRAWPTP